MSEERNPQSNVSAPPAEDKPRTGISRREFARRAALASAPAIVVPALGTWSPATSAPAPTPEAVGAQTPAPQAPAATASTQAPTTPAANAQTPNSPKLSPEAQA